MKTEIVYSTPWFDLVAKTLRPEEAPFYSLRLPDYVAILAFTEERRILAVRQYRPAVERYTIELPAGLVDVGENPAETAARELMEETGYRAARVEVLGAMTTDTGRLGNAIWGCVAEDCRRIEGREPEDGMAVQTYSAAELMHQVADGIFDHSLHLAVLMLAAARGRFGWV